MPIRRLLVLAVLAGLPKVASAQFTTFIPPKNTVADSVKAVVVAQQQARTDSVSQAQITNMKTWVDSAAGLAPTPTTASDSLAKGLPAPAALPADSTTFQNGMRAPATASDLPLLVLAGALLLGAGLLVVTGQREAQPAPVKPERNRTRA